MSEDPMRRLKAADPAARLGLEADDAMREMIMATDHTNDATSDVREQRTAGARHRRRIAVTSGLAAVLVGGSVAYATAGGWEWNRGSGGHDGLTCVTDWDAPEEQRSGGPELTGDPVADCARYQELTGLPAITDPVVFRKDGMLIVAPRSEVPQGATLEPVDPQHLALRELEASLRDEIDGLGSLCLDVDAAVLAARAELDRLGLDDWDVRVQERRSTEPEMECAGITYAYDYVAGDEPAWADGMPTGTPQARPADEDVLSPDGDESSAPAPAPTPTEPLDTTVPRTLAVIPHDAQSWETVRKGRTPFGVELHDVLLTEIAQACVDLDTAERITTAAIGGEHHWPTVVIEDPQATCTRVDLEVGGSVLVTLRGPRG